MYCIKTIAEEELIDCLLNPFERCFILDDLIYQKYEKEEKEGMTYKRGDELFDNVLILNKKYGIYELGCVVYYSKEQIFVYESKYFKLENDELGRYQTMDALRFKAVALMYKHLKSINESKIDELEETEIFQNYYERYKKEFYQPFVNRLLGVSEYKPVITDNPGYVDVLENTITEYVRNLDVEEIVYFNRDDLTSVFDYVEKIAFDEDNLNFLAFDKVEKEATEYALAGTLSVEDERVKDFMKKIKDCKATRFTVVTMSGEKVSCRNYLNTDASLCVLGEDGKFIYIKDIEEVIYGGKNIYKRAY